MHGGHAQQHVKSKGDSKGLRRSPLSPAAPHCTASPKLGARIASGVFISTRTFGLVRSLLLREISVAESPQRDDFAAE